jgi:hypothetical protein
MVSWSFGWVNWKSLHRNSWAESLGPSSQGRQEWDLNPGSSACEIWENPCTTYPLRCSCGVQFDFLKDVEGDITVLFVPWQEKLKKGRQNTVGRHSDLGPKISFQNSSNSNPNYSSPFTKNRFQKCQTLKQLRVLKVSTPNLNLIAYAVDMIVM